MPRLINRHPNARQRWFFGIVPFIAVIMIYLMASQARLAIDPADKLIPSFASWGSAMLRLAFTPDAASGRLLFWYDTYLSLWRLFVGLGICAALGLVLGILIGAIPLLRAICEPVLAALSLIPPIAVLPILFIIFGLSEISKIVLIVFGIAPFMIRDIVMRVQDLPREQIIKAQTLGAETWLIMTQVIMPQILPHLIGSVRLSLGATWLFIISAEAITAEGGLGYRIFLVRRYLAMDVILPYVIWITLLAYLIDYALKQLNAFAFPWTQLKEQ